MQRRAPRREICEDTVAAINGMGVVAVIVVGLVTEDVERLPSVESES